MWDGEEEEAVGGDGCTVEEEPGSAAGEEGGDNSFFSHDDDRDSWLPTGVVLELLLNVSPGRKKERSHTMNRLTLRY